MRRPRSILIVDDEPGTVRVLASVLEDAGYRVDQASNGRIALEMLATERPDLVLLDFLMPELDGCETLRTIRKTRAHAGLRVLMMSGVAESIVRRRCRGYDGFLRKPFGLDELLATVASMTEEKPPKKRAPAARPRRRR